MSEETITWEQLSKHITPTDCWMLIDGGVFNVSDFIVEHPGGDVPLMKAAGTDGTQAFENIGHSDYAVSLRDARKVGIIQNKPCPEGYLAKMQAIKKQNRSKLKQDAQNKLKNNIEKNKPVTTSSEDNMSRQVVKKHSSEEDCWIVIDNNVYNVTNFLEEHPGGVSTIMQFAGKDGTKAFNQAGHSIKALKQRQQFKIGKLRKNPNIYLVIAVSLVLGIILYVTCTY